MTTYCTATNKAGVKCPCFAVTDSDLCAAHNPQSIADRKRARARASLPTWIAKRADLARRIEKLTADLVDLDDQIADATELVSR